MNRKKFRILLFTLLALAGLSVIAYTASGGAGSQSDPLVTLSYLTETFTGQIMDKVDQLLVQRNEKLTAELSGGQVSSGLAQTYTAVTLTAGQTLYGEAGCEVLLRSGAASCIASAAPGLVDTTSGGTIAGGGQLQANHLYLMTDARAVTAPGGAALLVRGGYKIL